MQLDKSERFKHKYVVRKTTYLVGEERASCFA